MKINFIYRLIF